MLFSEVKSIHAGRIDYWFNDQGRSQPHSPGWARVPLSSFFPQILINFSYFSSNFYLFSSSFWLSGWASRPSGKVLATPLLMIHFWCKYEAYNTLLWIQAMRYLPKIARTINMSLRMLSDLDWLIQYGQVGTFQTSCVVIFRGVASLFKIRRRQGGGGWGGGWHRDSKWRLTIDPCTKCHFIWGLKGWASDWRDLSPLPGYAPVDLLCRDPG